MEHTIERALLALSSMDGDHAQYRNDVGFNGSDTDFGNSLALQVRGGRTLTQRQRAAAWKMLRKYRTQLLRDHEIDYTKIPPPDAFGPVEGVTGELAIMPATAKVTTSRPHPELLSLVRDIPGRRYARADSSWSWPLDSATIPETRKLILAFPFLKVSGAERLDELEAVFADNRDASQATDAELELPALGGELMPFQKAGVAYALANRSVMIGDEMGLGKTVQALATLLADSSFPAVIVVPAVVKLNWEREANKWLPGWNVAVLSGRDAPSLDDLGPETAELNNAALYIVNYDILPYWLDFLMGIGPQAVVFDESHYLKNSKARRTKAAKKLARAVKGPKLLLTGTPVMNRPVELISQLDVMGRLSGFGGFWGFARRYCNAYEGRYGWDLTGASHLDELHERLRSKCYVRRTKEQVLQELPPKRRVTVPMELSDRAEYQKIEDDLKDWFRRKVAEDEEFQEKLRHLSEALEAGMADIEELEDLEAERRHAKAMQAEALVKIEALKQTCATLKSDSVIAWISDFLESGNKLVVFAHHKEIVDLLAKKFDAPKITGDTTLPKRQEAVDRFQEDPETRLIVCNMQAGGVGITLTAASDVAVVELPWRPADLDQAEDRCHRIGQEDSVTAWYLLAAQTIEEDIARLIDDKRRVVDAATDGRLEAKETGILNSLLASLGEGR